MDGDRRLGGAMCPECPDVVVLSPKDFDALVFAVDENVFFKAGQGLVIVKFVASVKSFGSTREDFDMLDNSGVPSQSFK
jgi:hypothetical protein